MRKPSVEMKQNTPNQNPEKMWAELAPYYDVLYNWKDYQSESGRIHELIQKYKKISGNHLLDVACGTGNHIHYLKKHYDIIGLDLNPAMLKEARKKCPGIKFYCADMVSFNLDRKFDSIICLFSSIGYVKTYSKLKKVVRCFSDHLQPGGVLIIEPFLTKETYKTGQIFGDTMSGDGIKISRMNVSQRKGNLAILDFHLLLATKKGVQYFQDIHELALFDTDRFLETLRESGFKATYLKDGLMKDRGLFIGVKKG